MDSSSLGWFSRDLLEATAAAPAAAMAMDAVYAPVVSRTYKVDSTWELGPPVFSEEIAARAFQWVCFMLSLFLLLFYSWQYKLGTCGWEVIYVNINECIKYVIEIWYIHWTPASLIFAAGNAAEWLRYAEWLLTCPIILIALSRVGTAEGSYSKRTMRLLTSDQGTIVMGVTAAFATGFTKLAFFIAGLAYGANTFYTAGLVYLEAWRNVPDDCKDIVKYMAICWFSSWLMFPILFVLGPEGLYHITYSGSVIGHSIADVLSKNIWAIFEWWLEFNIHARYSAELDALEDETEGSESDDGKEKARVLLVTPNAASMTFFAEQMADLPAEVTECASVESFLGTLQASSALGEKYDLLFIDRAFCMGEMFKDIKLEFKIPSIVFAEGSEKQLDILRNSLSGLAEDVIEAPKQGEPYPRDFRSFFRELHAKFVSSEEEAPPTENEKHYKDEVTNLKAEIARMSSMATPAAPAPMHNQYGGGMGGQYHGAMMPGAMMGGGGGMGYSAQGQMGMPAGPMV